MNLRQLLGSCCLLIAPVGALAACHPGASPAGTADPSPARPAMAATASRSVAAGALTTASNAAPSATKTAPAARAMGSGAAVQVSSPEWDGEQFGVGFPVMLTFTRAPTNVKAFEQATTVTVNGRPAGGSWYWFNAGRPGIAIDAHYRTRDYWPAHAHIDVNAPLKGLSAGEGLVFENDLTLSLSTGPADISTVNASTLRMTVTRDGALVRTLAVSLGEAAHPTESGVKVVQEKDNPERMIGVGYDVLVPWSVRVTNSGEFVHAAPWNSQIGQASTSHGCTNLSTADAQWFFQFSQIGDVVAYPTTNGPRMPVWDGYGDWNVPWPQWVSGGNEAD